jgi:hypothetical protein
MFCQLQGCDVSIAGDALRWMGQKGRKGKNKEGKETHKGIKKTPWP